MKKTKGAQSRERVAGNAKKLTQRTLRWRTEDTEKKSETRLTRQLGAREWESDGDGGLGTSLFALLCGREVEVRPGFTGDRRL